MGAISITAQEEETCEKRIQDGPEPTGVTPLLAGPFLPCRQWADENEHPTGTTYQFHKLFCLYDGNDFKLAQVTPRESHFH